MFAEALKARLPLISITTEDPYHVPQLIRYYTGWTPTDWAGINMTNWNASSSHGMVFYTNSPLTDSVDAYKVLRRNESTLVLINPEEDYPMTLHAGEVSIPQGLLLQFLKKHLNGPVQEISSMLHGLSLKEVYEIISISAAKHHEITPQSISEVRRQFTSGKPGIYQVDTTLGFYDKSKEVDGWLKYNKWVFGSDLHPSLIPRGLLFDGAPGTGKTMASKYIANEMGIPLFSLSLGSMLEKWVGASERHLEVALNTVDAAAPCVILIDEVEKVIAVGDDSGVSSRMLSGLLWWLQEHTSRVLTILTTNDRKKLPTELYRPGRIDGVITFSRKNWAFASIFAQSLCEYYEGMYPDSLKPVVLENLVMDSLYKGSDSNALYSYAEITGVVVRMVKRCMAKSVDNPQ
ncbi:MAG: AAA family ATPase [bacterium]